MKKLCILILSLVFIVPIYSQKVMNIHKTSTQILGYDIDSVNSMRYTDQMLAIDHKPNISDSVLISGIDSITFTVDPAVPVGMKYTNPVSTKSLPDPTVIRAKDGYYYAYATEDIHNMPILRSKDMRSWLLIGTVFSEIERPNFEPGGGLWAPSINYINGKYVIYYAMSVWGGQMTCGIGVAESDSPKGPFVNAKMLFRSTGEGGIGVQNSIDACYIEEGGRKYLFWGSFNGIYGVELSDDGLSLKPGAVKKQVAGNWFEASYVYKKNGYFYLFASIGSCCAGVESTYEVVVGRSRYLFGPYENRVREKMMNNKFEYVVRANQRFVGNGHNSEIVTDDYGNEWFLYHGYDKLNPAGRRLFLSQIHWTEDGWPYITDGTPPLSANGPVIYK